jgi:3D (Asp-Asp-Asp) domain-containing protein
MPKTLVLSSLVSILVLSLGALTVSAQEPVDETASTGVAWRVEVQDSAFTQPEPTGFWPSIRRWLVGKAALTRPTPGTVFIVTSSAYASSPYQTDSTPCITAAGTRVRKGVVATNFLPMGTILSINGELYIVEDRMNARFKGKYLDIWFPSTSEALEFGRRKLEIIIVDYGTPGQELTSEPVVKPNVFKRAGLRFMAASRTLTGLIRTTVVNRHDVDCTKE